MRRPLRVLLSAALLAAALLSLASALSAATLTYYLPPIETGAEASQHTAVFLPGVVASIVAGVTTLATAVWVALVVRGPRPRAHWLAVAGIVVLDLLVLVVVGALGRPTF